jgi:hypothetical protein
VVPDGKKLAVRPRALDVSLKKYKQEKLKKGVILNFLFRNQITVLVIP